MNIKGDLSDTSMLKPFLIVKLCILCEFSLYCINVQNVPL